MKNCIFESSLLFCSDDELTCEDCAAYWIDQNEQESCLPIHAECSNDADCCDVAGAPTVCIENDGSNICLRREIW